MRMKDRAIAETEAISILKYAEYGVLSTVNENGRPYGVPLNFCFIDNAIYFHCATEGQKIDNINYSKSVSFCAVGKTEIIPEEYTTRYESVIVSGEIEEVFDSDKQMGLEGLLHKYSADFFDQGVKYIRYDARRLIRW